MFFDWSPGVLFISKSLLKVYPPLFLVFIVHRIIPFYVSGYVWVAAYVLAIPVAMTLQASLQYIREEREIMKLGARRVPRIRYRWPGAIDVIALTERSLRGGYLFDWTTDFIRENGSTFNMRILWDDMFFTTEPDVIKSMLASDFDKFEKGPKFKSWMQSVLGTGVFNSDGDMWKYVLMGKLGKMM